MPIEQRRVGAVAVDPRPGIVEGLVIQRGRIQHAVIIRVDGEEPAAPGRGKHMHFGRPQDIQVHQGVTGVFNARSFQRRVSSGRVLLVIEYAEVGRGGIGGIKKLDNGRYGYRSVRPVRGVGRNVELNADLWRLADSYAKVA